MTLIAFTLGAASPKFKCSTCELEFQGTTRAANHLHAREPYGSVRQCPTDVALFPTSSCTDEGSFRKASQMPGALPPGGFPDNQPCGPFARTAALY